VRHFHLDRVVALERGVRALGVRSVALSDDVFTEHFPGNPVLPGVYVLEGLAQTAGVLLWETTGHARVAVMTSVERARFVGFARPGEVVQLAVDIESLDDDAARVRGAATVGDRAVTTARFTFSLQRTDHLIPSAFQPFWRQAVDVWMGRFPEKVDG
jgi:3-hydroxyacyl-[acyl-carrier-protein] dehydratase